MTLKNWEDTSNTVTLHSLFGDSKWLHFGRRILYTQQKFTEGAKVEFGQLLETVSHQLKVATGESL